MDSSIASSRIVGGIIERTYMAAKKAGKAKPRKAVRANAKQKPGDATPGQRKKTQGRGKKRPAKASTPLELQLRKTVAELGLRRARKIFASFEEAFGD